MNKIVIAMLVLLLSAGLSWGKSASHIKTQPEQECAECHAGQDQSWNEGKHGLMNVRCVVCHGSTETRFIPKPDIYRCRGCHAEKVSEVEKQFAPKQRKCTLCHTPHSVTSKFHREGVK